MDVTLEGRLAGFVEEAVRSGRYTSASAVIRDALSLLREREEKIRAIREEIDAAIAEGGELTDEEVGARLDATYRELMAER